LRRRLNHSIAQSILDAITAVTGVAGPKQHLTGFQIHHSYMTSTSHFLCTGRTQEIGPRSELSLLADRSNSSDQLVEQRLRFLQIARIEAFGEPAVDRSEQFARLLRLGRARDARGSRLVPRICCCWRAVAQMPPADTAFTLWRLHALTPSRASGPNEPISELFVCLLKACRCRGRPGP
jgi:hypothetical protein